MSTDASNEAQNGDGKRKRQAHSTEGVPSKPRNACRFAMPSFLDLGAIPVLFELTMNDL